MNSIQKLFSGLRISSSGMAAQRERANVISENIANAEVTRMPDGSGPYRRKVVHFEPILRDAQGETTGASIGVRVSKVAPDTKTPFEIVHEPGHPDADAQGNVSYPNVNATKEMADLVLAMRGYDANMSAQDTFVRMAERALKLAQ